MTVNEFLNLLSKNEIYPNMFCSGTQNGQRKMLDVPFSLILNINNSISKKPFMQDFSAAFDSSIIFGTTWEDLFRLIHGIHDTLMIGSSRPATIFVPDLKTFYHFAKKRIKIKKEFFKNSVAPLVIECDDDLDGFFIKSVKELTGYDLQALRKQYDAQPDALILNKAVSRLTKSIKNDKRRCIGSLPLTKTQIVKSEVMSILMPWRAYRKAAYKAHLDINSYRVYNDCMSGGLVRARCVDLEYGDTTAFDITSDYLYALCVEDFPFGSAEYCETPSINSFKYIRSSGFLYCVTLEIKNIEIKPGFYDYLKRAKNDIYSMTSVDFDEFEKHYNFSIDFIFELVFTRQCRTLFPTLRYYILEKFRKKTKLKDDPENEELYEVEKTKCNAIFGLLCKKIIRTHDPELSDEEILTKAYEDNPYRLPFYIGIFCTAYARKYIINACDHFNPDLILYLDTDMLCVSDPTGDATEIFAQINSERLQRILNSELGYSMDSISESTKAGMTSILGMWEPKWVQRPFKAAGCKFYGVELDSGIKIACSGALKEASTAAIRSLNDISSHVVIPKGRAQYDIIDHPYDVTFDGIVYHEESGIYYQKQDFKYNPAMWRLLRAQLGEEFESIFN